MLNIQVSKRKDTEDYVAVETLPISLPFTMRQFFIICSICIFSLLCALPVLSPDRSFDDETDEDQLPTSLYALLGTPYMRPAAINEKQMGEKYLAENEQEVLVTPVEVTEENYDDDVSLPRDFFILQTVPKSKPQEQLVADTEIEPQPEQNSEISDPQELAKTKGPEEIEIKEPIPAINQVRELKEIAEKLKVLQREPLAIPVQETAEAEVKVTEAPKPEVKPVIEIAQQPEVKVEKRPEGIWYQLSVSKGQSLSEIFSELNLSTATLRRLKKVAKGRELALSAGDELHLLVDDHNILKELVKPLPQGDQVRFTRMSSKNDFTVVHEKKNAHVKDPKEIAKFLDASKMPSALEAASKAAKREELKLAQQNIHLDQAAQEEAYNLAYINRPQLVVGTLQAGEGIKKAARRLGLDKAALDELQSAVLTKVNLSRLRSNDKLRILFSGRGASSHIQAIEIDSQIYGKVTVFKHPQNNNFYEENEFHPTTGVFRRFPITGQIKITSPFNPKRIHPIMHRIAPHNGVDFKVPIGTPIYSPADGVVSFSGYVRGGGYTVIINHSNNYSTVYMHLSKFDVKNGQAVKAGQIIAKSGNTGRSTGPHLHYEIRIDDHPVDPLKVDLPNNRSPKLAQAEKVAFDNSVRSLKAQLYKK